MLQTSCMQHVNKFYSNDTFQQCRLHASQEQGMHQGDDVILLFEYLYFYFVVSAGDNFVLFADILFAR